MGTTRFPGLYVTAFGALLTIGSSTLPARAADVTAVTEENVGRIAFDFQGAPPAVVEVDLGESMLFTLSGVAQASVRGVVQALSDGGPPDTREAIELTGQQLQAVNELFEVARKVIQEVRVRVYEDLSQDARTVLPTMVRHYQDKLAGTQWDQVVQVRDNRSHIVLCVLQQDAAVRGLFLMVAENDDLVLANIVCDLSPEKVEHFTSQATRIGRKVGLDQLIEHAVSDIHRGPGRLGMEAAPRSQRAPVDAPVAPPAPRISDGVDSPATGG